MPVSVASLTTVQPFSTQVWAWIDWPIARVVSKLSVVVCNHTPALQPLFFDRGGDVFHHFLGGGGMFFVRSVSTKPNESRFVEGQAAEVNGILSPVSGSSIMTKRLVLHPDAGRWPSLRPAARANASSSSIHVALLQVAQRRRARVWSSGLDVYTFAKVGLLQAGLRSCRAWLHPPASSPSPLDRNRPYGLPLSQIVCPLSDNILICDALSINIGLYD